MIIPDHPGTYILVMRLGEPATIVVGRLGALCFPAGYYVYVGSALCGLRVRLARHLRRAKRLHWHIDYLLERATIDEIWYATTLRRCECAWAQALGRVPGITPFPAPFGASDCVCRTHLFYAATRPISESLQALLADQGDVLSKSAEN